MTAALITPRASTIILSSGSITPYEILAPYGSDWPTDAYCTTVFRNTAGAVLATVEAQEVLPDRIRYLFRPDGDQAVDGVPAGARFESFIELDEGPFKLRYGVVQRAEARFPDAGPTGIVPGPRVFSDIFLRSALGFRWEAVYGSTKIFVDNPISKNPIGLGPNTNLYTGKPAAVRYYQPLATDSVEVSMTIQMPLGIVGASTGQTRAVFCADQSMRGGLAIEADSNGHQVRMARVVGPGTYVYVGTAATGITFADGDIFTARFNNLTSTLGVYRGSSTSPMVSPWVDTAHLAPHGNGYRYLHLDWDPALLETGPLISGWTAKDAA